MILTDLQTYTPYRLDPTKSTFHSILAILFHAYDNNPPPPPPTTRTDTRHYPVSSPNIMQPRNTSHHRCICDNQNKYPIPNTISV